MPSQLWPCPKSRTQESLWLKADGCKGVQGRAWTGHLCFFELHCSISRTLEQCYGVGGGCKHSDMETAKAGEITWGIVWMRA